MFDFQRFPDDKAILIKPFSEDTFLDNEETLIALLKENMEINFPEVKIDKHYAIDIYNKMMIYQKDGSAILIGAFLDKRLLGFIWAYKRESFGEKRIHVSHIVVQSDLRSKGLGETLLKNLEQHSKVYDFQLIELMCSIKNKKALDFYNRNGFSPTRFQLEKKLDVSHEN